LARMPNRVLGSAGALHPGPSDVDFLGDLESVVDLYTKVAKLRFRSSNGRTKVATRAGFRCGSK
jgi:hypothetical protein